MKEIMEVFFKLFQKGLNSANYRHEMFELIYDIDSIVETSDDLIRSLYNYSNLSRAPQLLSELYFFPQIEESEGYLIFGSSLNGYDYALRKKDKEVCIIDVDTKSYFFSIAKSEIAFIQVLIKMIEFKLHFLEKKGMTPNISREIRRECIRLAGGDAYSKLYRFIVISKGDQPQERFTLP